MKLTFPPKLVSHCWSQSSPWWGPDSFLNKCTVWKWLGMKSDHLKQHTAWVFTSNVILSDCITGSKSTWMRDFRPCPHKLKTDFLENSVLACNTVTLCVGVSPLFDVTVRYFVHETVLCNGGCSQTSAGVNVANRTFYMLTHYAFHQNLPPPHHKVSDWRMAQEAEVYAE